MIGFRQLATDLLQELGLKPTSARVTLVLGLLHDVLTLIGREAPAARNEMRAVPTTNIRSKRKSSKLRSKK